ncbi:dnaJ homolog subfamily C member 22-like isoform X2 [Anopheles albimanus]|nr:dnaJ homolog subfamily C member 22-like isoform X2 [Anopheles albimanus]XP_035790249.1 dnaJ homolog subfamily C member 22-like isoform X2 [Anopheles albimanus]XP_035790250.1 dnaJ homolog subfamily C member 22-like isoform X2 [Anopheles albimanus]
MGEKLSPSLASDGSSVVVTPTLKEKVRQRRNSKEEKVSKRSGHHPVWQPDADRPPQKSLLVAYLLWLFGGVLGVHHFYLRQDRRAFLWWSTLGYFGIGWLAEALQIPAMVRDANDDPRFVKEFNQLLRTNRKPPFSTGRFLLAIMIGYWWGQMIMIAIPQTVFFGLDWGFLHWTIPFGVALGVWTVGNMGREKGVFWHCLVAAYGSYLSRYFLLDEAYWFTAMAFCCAFAFDHFSKEWNLEVPKRKRMARRLATLTAAAVIYLSLWGCFVYFNGTITDSEGDEVPVHEALYNFLKSPWWTDLKQTLYDTLQFAKHHGWSEVWKQIIDSMDADGEQNAYKVLGLSATASQNEINTLCRSLAKETHPDKVKDESKRRAAEERFMEIQQACEVLSKTRRKRRQRNKKSDEL